MPSGFDFDLEENIIFKTESEYSIIKVIDTPKERMLKLNNMRFVQSKIDKTGGTRGYIDYFNVGPALNGGRNVLLIGLAGGSAVKSMLEFDGMKVDAVEIDPKVIDVGKKYFDLKESENVKFYAEDGRRYLMKTDEKYDIILLDAFSGGDGLPFHLATSEFFTLCSERLTPNGVLMMNVIDMSEDKFFLKTIDATVKKAFPKFYHMGAGGNNIGVGCKNECTLDEVKTAIKNPENKLPLSIRDKIEETLVEYDSNSSTIYTDDLSNIDENQFIGIKDAL